MWGRLGFERGLPDRHLVQFRQPNGSVLQEGVDNDGVVSPGTALPDNIGNYGPAAGPMQQLNIAGHSRDPDFKWNRIPS